MPGPSSHDGVNLGKIGKATALAAATCVFVTGCATPPAFVSAKAATPEINLRIESIQCSRLAELLAMEQRNEKQMSDEMASRAGKQLLLNAVGVAALEIGGYGFVYHVRGEGDRRDSLSATRGEIEVMKTVLAEKRCRPDGSAPEPGYVAIVQPDNSARIESNPAVMVEIAALGGTRCADDPADTSAESQLRRGRLLASINEYDDAMRCMLRATETGRGTSVYQEACEFIATMYEQGWGVARSLDTAKFWIAKAGA